MSLAGSALPRPFSVNFWRPGFRSWEARGAMHESRGHRRRKIYFTGWAVLTAAAFVLRYSLFPDAEERFNLVATYLVTFGFALGAVSTYEHRRLVVDSGWRGRGVLGYLRGWVKTPAAALAADSPGVNPQAELDLRLFNRLAAWLFGSLVVVLPLLAI